MADEQDRPDQPGGATPPAAEPPALDPTPPAKHAGARAAKKAPAKAAKKAPAKAAKAAKGAKATPKKVAKKAAPPPPPAEPPPAPQPAAEPEPPIAAEPPVASPDPLRASGSSTTLADTNGETQFGAADQTAAQARQAVDTAGDSLATGITRVPGTGSRVPIAVALAMALLAILLIRRLLSDD